jgi:hypothetical protein
MYYCRGQPSATFGHFGPTLQQSGPLMLYFEHDRPILGLDMILEIETRLFFRLLLYFTKNLLPLFIKTFITLLFVFRAVFG